MHVLLIEDDSDYAFLMGEILRFNGSESTLASTAESARRWMLRNRPDLIVLDLSLGGEDTLELSQWLRNAYREIPVVLVSSQDHPEDVVQGFEAGADDYIVKPFHPREFSARIKAVARRAGIAAGGHTPSRISAFAGNRDGLPDFDSTGTDA